MEAIATTQTTSSSMLPERKTGPLTEASLSIQHCDYCACRPFCEASPLSSYQQESLFRAHRVPRHKHIFYAGDELTTLYVVKSGGFKTYFNTASGDEQVMGFHMRGDVLGADALAHRYHSLSAVALETSTVCAVTINKLESVANQFQPHWLIGQVYNEVLRERRVLQITGRKYSAYSRIAIFLLDMIARNKARGYSDREFKLNMPHRDIAHHLDMALETVSRAFTRLQRAGIVTITRPYITIQKPEELLALADMSSTPEKLDV